MINEKSDKYVDTVQVVISVMEKRNQAKLTEVLYFYI